MFHTLPRINILIWFNKSFFKGFDWMNKRKVNWMKFKTGNNYAGKAHIKQSGSKQTMYSFLVIFFVGSPEVINGCGLSWAYPENLGIKFTYWIWHQINQTFYLESEACELIPARKKKKGICHLPMKNTRFTRIGCCGRSLHIVEFTAW